LVTAFLCDLGVLGGERASPPSPPTLSHAGEREQQGCGLGYLTHPGKPGSPLSSACFRPPGAGQEEFVLDAPDRTEQGHQPVHPKGSLLRGGEV